MLTAHDRKSEQEYGSNANCYSAERAARDAERASQLRLANAQRNQRDKFEREAAAIQKNVQRDQPFKAESKA